MTADITDLKALLGRVAAGERLEEADSARAFEAMISGNATTMIPFMLFRAGSTETGS